MIGWRAAAGALAVLGALGGAAAGGWHARAVLAERDALRAANEAAEGFRKATEAAGKATDDYIRKRDALQPEIRIIRTEGRTIVRELDRCPLPADAGGLLDRAASAADGAARGGNSTDAARSEDRKREPVGG